MKKISIYIILSLVLIACETKKATVLNVQAFEDLISAEPSLQLVDVRTPQEFQSGHLQDALLIDMYSPAFESRLDNLNKHQPIAVYCAVGSRSQQVYELLQEKGFTKVYHLDGGIQAWREERKPIVFD
jgi:rhodanese-related sulfurtransferase